MNDSKIRGAQIMNWKFVTSNQMHSLIKNFIMKSDSTVSDQLCIQKTKLLDFENV